MSFSYRGFEQNQGLRTFTFLQSAGTAPHATYHISVNLAILAENNVSMQEAPELCVQLLTRAMKESEVTLASYMKYELLAADLQAFTAPRRALAVERANKRSSRTFHPKPGPASQPFQGVGVAR
jgi:hypothetical protein